VIKFLLRTFQQQSRKGLLVLWKDVNIRTEANWFRVYPVLDFKAHHNEISEPIKTEKTLDYASELPGFQEEF
jgi:hypothetical protein